MDGLSNTIVPTSDQITRLIASDLAEIERRLKTEANSELPLINEMNNYLHDGGGKRLRPTVLLLAAGLCGASKEASIQLGVVVELIHVATLVHDDIIDNASSRRGQESVNCRWGNQCTVLFGDWLYMTAFWLALKEENFRILDTLIDVTRRMVEGELFQLSRNHRLDLSREEYFHVINCKTAHLFSSCGRLPAIQAGLVKDREEALARYGRNVGTAFQLTDDLLDYVSEEEVLGKPVLKDLQEGKVTLPIINLLESASDNEREFIQKVTEEGDFSKRNKLRILDFVHRHGALQELKETAQKFAAEAKQDLISFPPSPYRDALESIPELILARQK